MDGIWDYYFHDLYDQLWQRFYSGEQVMVENLQINQDGIVIEMKGLMNKQQKTIAWQQVRTVNYHSYFGIYDANDAAGTHATFNYLESWNAWLIHILIKGILNEKGIEKSN